MLLHMKMTVKLPVGTDPQQAERLKAEEKEVAQRLQCKGSWRHLRRVARRYANCSLFDLPSVEALHDTLTRLSLFPYMDIEIDGPCRHPSSIHVDDR